MKTESSENSFTPEVLTEKGRSRLFRVIVVFHHVDKVNDHFRL